MRAMSVLSYLGEHRDGLTLRALSDDLHIPVATAHRMLAALEEQEFVLRDPQTRRYTVGAAALGLAKAARLPAEVVPPFGRRLATITGETVFMTQLVGARVVCVWLDEGKRPFRLLVRVGQEMPAHAAASARCLLAFQPRELVDGILAGQELVRYQERTSTTVAAVRSRMSQIRDRGYDVSWGELDAKVAAASAPVRSAAGDVVAALTIAAMHERVDQPMLLRRVRLVCEASAAVSEALGYRAKAGSGSGAAGLVTGQRS